MHIEDRLAQLSPSLTRSFLLRNAPFPSAALRTHTRVRHGWYVENDFWATLNDEDRQLIRLLAVQHSATHPPVFSHVSAALLHGLPTWTNALSSAVHVTVSPRSSNTLSRDLVRHRALLDVGEVTQVGGLLCTTPERTFYDLASQISPEDAITFIDAYLRQMFRVNRLIDHESLDAWNDQMRRRILHYPPARGRKMSLLAAAAADPRTDSPLESVSHLYLRQLGFDVSLQVQVAAPQNRSYHLDFEFNGLDLFGECDGRIKYTKQGMLHNDDLSETLYREKLREDWIRGSTGKRLIRWGYADLRSLVHFERRLRAFSVPIARSTMG